MLCQYIMMLNFKRLQIQKLYKELNKTPGLINYQLGYTVQVYS
uniref:Uncharacterized protein n=1 Tax=Amphimedon queenslandica TaxID=400682 RepID=A0A1X7V5D1_AMPQE